MKNFTNPIQLLALDLDGTLFNNSGQVTPACREAIREADDAGVCVVISTGRPLCGVPFDQLKGCGIRYAITTNGSAIYELDTRKCIFESPMDTSSILPILAYLDTKDIHMDAFLNGNAFSSWKCLPAARRLDMPESLRHYILTTRVRVYDLTAFIRINQLCVQKMTLNFYPTEDGTLKDRESVRKFLEERDDIQCVSGGYHNLEFTKAGVTKGLGLRELAGRLDIPMEQTAAIGDTENDLSILEAAGLGIAMGNATDEVKAAAGYITASNEEDGVAQAIREKIVGRER